MTSIFVMNFLLWKKWEALLLPDDDDDISALYCYKCWYCNFQQLVLNRSVRTYTQKKEYLHYISCHTASLYVFLFFCVQNVLFSHSLEHFHNSAYFFFFLHNKCLHNPVASNHSTIFCFCCYIHMCETKEELVSGCWRGLWGLAHFFEYFLGRL